MRARISNNINKYFTVKQSRGMALILTILLMSLILFLSLYLLSFTLTENRIAKSQSWGAKTYYLAEAGIQEMVWQLKNNSAYKQNFETNPSWTASFTRTNPFGSDNGSYTVSIANSGLAHGVITSTGTINIGSGKTSQRIVKTYVYRAMGQTGVQNNAGYADGNTDITASQINILEGGLHSNINVLVKLISTVNIDDNLDVVNNYNKSDFSTVNVGGTIHSKEYPPEAASIAMPAVDFDSTSPNSLKNRATVVYTKAQFDNLIAANPNLILNGPITYVDGDIELKCDREITVNGLLVSSRDINIGKFSWGCLFQCGQSDITVNHASGVASGLLAKRKINFDPCTGEVNVNGVVYASDEFKTLSLPQEFNIIGGLIGRKLTMTSIWQPINITINNQYLSEVLGVTEFSPIITVEHWEEEY
ncbi:MAG: hypothetical protein WCV70_00625 [Patescibacteria group bacterium]|jgi:Tfp pilus assembly protein PilX